MGTKLQWIFFDVGATLSNEEPGQVKRYETARRDILLACGKDVSCEEFFKAIYDAAALGADKPFYGAMRSFGVNKLYDYDRNLEVLYPDVIPTLEKLKKRYKLGIIANQPAGLEKRLKALGILEYFDAVFGSDDVGYSKPDTAFYRFALDKTACPASQAVMIGDRPDNDVAPARSVGMKTVRVLRSFFKVTQAKNEEQIPDATVQTLADIPDILSKWEEN